MATPPPRHRHESPRSPAPESTRWPQRRVRPGRNPRPRPHSAILKFGDVAACRERKVTGAKDDHAQIRFGEGDGAGIGHCSVHRRRHGVASVGVVDRDGGDRSDPLVAEENGSIVVWMPGTGAVCSPAGAGGSAPVVAAAAPGRGPAFLHWLRRQPLASSAACPRLRQPRRPARRVGTDLGASEWITSNRTASTVSRTPPVITSGSMSIREGRRRSVRRPIAHGYLTLSLTNQFLPEIVRVDNVSMGINYGVNKVRFPQPVVVGRRFGHRRAGRCAEINGGVQAVITITVEIEGATSRRASSSRSAAPAMSSRRPRQGCGMAKRKEEPNRADVSPSLPPVQPGLLSPTCAFPPTSSAPAVTGDPGPSISSLTRTPTNSPRSHRCGGSRNPSSPVRWSDPVSPPTRSTSLFIRRALTPAGIRARSTTAATRSQCARRSTRSSVTASHRGPRRRRHHQYRRDPLHARRARRHLHHLPRRRRRRAIVPAGQGDCSVARPRHPAVRPGGAVNEIGKASRTMPTASARCRA